jgi:hypothetical protein
MNPSDCYDELERPLKLGYRLTCFLRKEDKVRVATLVGFEGNLHPCLTDGEHVEVAIDIMVGRRVGGTRAKAGAEYASSPVDDRILQGWVLRATYSPQHLFSASFWGRQKEEVPEDLKAKARKGGEIVWITRRGIHYLLDCVNNEVRVRCVRSPHGREPFEYHVSSAAMGKTTLAEAIDEARKGTPQEMIPMGSDQGYP